MCGVRGALPFAMFVVVVAGCAAIAGIDTFSVGEAPEDASIATPKNDAEGPAGDANARQDSGADATSTADAGVAMVSIVLPDGGSFSIDSTEVTQSEYAKFLLSKAGDTTGQVPLCVSNTTYLPDKGWSPQTTPSRPVVGVDWCDARAYCAWAGKHLCRGISKVPLTLLDSLNPSKSQWMYACTKGGLQSFSYGATENSSACNVLHVDGGASADVATRSTCVGGFPDLYDMVGNATEWVDARDLDAGNVAIVGGSWGFPSTGPVACNAFTATPPNFAFGDLSFRCCKD